MLIAFIFSSIAVAYVFLSSLAPPFHPSAIPTSVDISTKNGWVFYMACCCVNELLTGFCFWNGEHFFVCTLCYPHTKINNGFMWICCFQNKFLFRNFQRHIFSFFQICISLQTNLCVCHLLSREKSIPSRSCASLPGSWRLRRFNRRRLRM